MRFLNEKRLLRVIRSSTRKNELRIESTNKFNRILVKNFIKSLRITGLWIFIKIVVIFYIVLCMGTERLEPSRLSLGNGF